MAQQVEEEVAGSQPEDHQYDHHGQGHEQEQWSQEQWDEWAHAFEEQRLADANAEFERQLTQYELAPEWVAQSGQCPNKLMFRYHRFSLDDMEPYFGIRDLYRNVCLEKSSSLLY